MTSPPLDYTQVQADFALVSTCYGSDWHPDPHMHDTVYATGVNGRGPARLADVRGWGYLTGGGHGALGLPQDRGRAVQDAVARLISATPALLADNARMREVLEEREAARSQPGAACPSDCAESGPLRSDGGRA